MIKKYIAMKKHSHNSFNYLIAATLGMMLTLSFAPFEFWYLAIISIAGLHQLLLRNKQLKFSIGLFYGIGLFGTGVSWIFVSIHRFGNLHEILAGFFTSCFVMSMALMMGLVTLLHQKISAYSSYKNQYYALYKDIFLLPILIVILEWIRSNILSGFPWLLIGYGQIDGIFKSFTPVIGVYGVTFITCLFSCALSIAFKYKANKKLLLSSLTLPIIIAISSYTFSQINWVQNTKTKKSVTLCQSNLSPVEKMTTYGTTDKTWEVYGDLTTNNLSSDLIIWPENSVPVVYPVSKNFLATLQTLVGNNNSGMILGLLSLEHKNNTYNIYNSLATIDKQDIKFYHKQHLVPFGEYVPYSKLLIPIMQKLGIEMANIDTKPNHSILQVNNINILPSICYEITFSRHIRNILQQGNVDVIVNISEDGWFGNSIGPKQHLQIARARALESGKYVIRSATSGVTAIIDSNGNVTKQLPQFTKDCLTGDFYFTQGQTPWVKYGDLWLLGLISMILISISINYSMHATRNK